MVLHQRNGRGPRIRRYRRVSCRRTWSSHWFVLGPGSVARGRPAVACCHRGCIRDLRGGPSSPVKGVGNEVEATLRSRTDVPANASARRQVNAVSAADESRASSSLVVGGHNGNPPITQANGFYARFVGLMPIAAALVLTRTRPAAGRGSRPPGGRPPRRAA